MYKTYIIQQNKSRKLMEMKGKRKFVNEIKYHFLPLTKQWFGVTLKR